MEGPATARRKPLCQCRALVIDADNASLQLMELMLAKKVKSVDISQNREDAISRMQAAAKAGGYDMVLCDVRTGLGSSVSEVEKKVKGILPFALVIHVSSYGGIDVGLPQGALCIDKPISMGSLFSLLDRHFPG